MDCMFKIRKRVGERLPYLLVFFQFNRLCIAGEVHLVVRGADLIEYPCAALIALCQYSLDHRFVLLFNLFLFHCLLLLSRWT